MAAKRRCTAKTKKGKRCTRAPLIGEKVCIAHAPKELKEARGFGGPQPGSGPPPKPKPTEIAKRLVEENIATILAPHFRTLGYDIVIDDTGPRIVKQDGGGAKLHGVSAKDGYVFVSDHDDLGAHIAAAEKLLDRVWGKPRQALEHAGSETGVPVAIVAAVHAPTGPDETAVARAAHDFLRIAGAAPVATGAA